MAQITLDRVVKHYGAVDVVHGVSLDIADKEFMVFVGPSGCGKSTLLRMVAGLETISDGTVHIGETCVNQVEPRHRDIAMVFQDYALYPHMTVRENLVFGLKMRGASGAEMAERLAHAAKVLQIEPLLDRKPGALSGGQRQRVAMGRAIVRRPSAFLFDEPLSNLDAKLRVDMRTEIKRLHALLQTTTIYVTHDQVEAMTLADRITVLRGGRIEQVGTPAELYANPANTFVAEFIGSPAMNLLPGRYDAARQAVVLQDGPAIATGAFDTPDGADVILGMRPEHLQPRDQGAVGAGSDRHEAVIEVVEPLGADTMALCRIDGVTLGARLAPDPALAAQTRITLIFDRAHMHLFDAATGERLAAE